MTDDKIIREINARINDLWRSQDEDMLCLFFRSLPWRYEHADAVEGIAVWMLDNQKNPQKIGWFWSKSLTMPRAYDLLWEARKLTLEIVKGLAK